MNRLIFLSSKKKHRQSVQLQFKEQQERMTQIMDQLSQIQDVTQKMSFSIEILQNQRVLSAQLLVSMFCSVSSGANFQYAKELSELVLDQLINLDNVLLNCNQQSISSQNYYRRLNNKDATLLKTLKESVSLSGIQFQYIIQPEYFQTLLYIIANNEINNFGEFSQQFYSYLEKDLIKGPGMKTLFIQIFNEMALYYCPESEEQLKLALDSLYYDGFCYKENSCITQFCLIQLINCSKITFASNRRLFENVFLHNIGTCIAYCVQFMRRSIQLSEDYMPIQRFFERFMSFQGIQRLEAICLWKFLAETSELITDNRLAQLLMTSADRLNNAYPDQQSYEQTQNSLNHIIYNS